MLSIHLIPALRDNYIFVLRAEKERLTAVVDPAESQAVIQFLEEKKWSLDQVLVTHHHHDHTGGCLGLKEKYGCRIVGHRQDASRIPGLDIALQEGERHSFGPHQSQVLALDGHTLGHIAYHFADESALFCGDTLFSIGCGRLFEGHASQMWESLQKIKALPDDTQVYCAHEYTLQNIEFALSLPQAPRDELIAYQNKVKALRERGLASIPCHLGSEKRLNPFLNAENLKCFTERRRAKDEF